MKANNVTRTKAATLLGAVIVGLGLGVSFTFDLGLTGLWVALLIGTPISLALEHAAIRRSHAPAKPRRHGGAGAGAGA